MYQPHTEFALALHEQLPAEGNLPWSPYSVASALGLAAAGARGQTYQELARLLAPGGDLAGLGRVLTGAADLPDAGAADLPDAGAAGLPDAGAVESSDAGAAELAVANALWVDRRLRLRDDFADTVRAWPGGTVHTADFRQDPEGSRSSINGDVAGTTRGLIRDLLAEGTITRQTAAVIVNALYLKVAWRSAFEAAATAPAPFHAPSGTRPVPTMRQRESFRYAATGGWRMVTLPTASEVEIDLLLPDQPDDRLTAATLAALHDASRMTKLDLAVPKFRVEAAMVLTDQLRQLGVVAAFTRGAADFSGIADEEMVIDTVVHKAVLRVDEQGFEGAAATAVVMRLVSMDLGGRAVPFLVDRPFLLVARHRRTGANYFLARIAEP